MGLGPWYGLCPMIWASPNEGHSPDINSSATGEAKPRRTSDGKAEAKDF
jgi:hypothetical protein